ncbi:MAG: fumarylacetoacetate hydrolase family protein [Syntrophales bacterium]
MKIVRFLSHGEKISYGIYAPERPDEALEIEGDIFGEFRMTERRLKIEKWLAPVDPPNILALGINYRQHGDETQMTYPDIPVLFLKATTSITGPGSVIWLPRAGPSLVDYEGELAVVIGRRVKNIPKEEALSCVLGYTCANDVSARDWQFHKQKNQWARGKSFDSFCPIGPYIVTADEILDPNNLRISTLLNGSIVQDSDTSDMIFDVPSIISNLSMSMTLLPGTVILTGTPEGVGYTRNPPVFLNPGDIVSVSIEGIGELSNVVRCEE